MDTKPSADSASTPPASAAAGPSHGPPQGPPGFAGLPEIEVAERGGRREGVQQLIDSRLFFQLLVYRTPASLDIKSVRQALITQVTATGLGAVLYEDVNDPRSFGLVTWSLAPEDFVTRLRPIFAEAPLSQLDLRDDMTMFGRTYGGGHEPDLKDWLFDKPRRNLLAPESRFGIWYPLRRTGAFNRLDPHEQSMILREHAAIGFAYGQKGLAADVRLACFGMDARDNDFVIGVIGHDLHPLSHVVQSMRKTKQTSEYIEDMGPFFVGHATFRTPGVVGSPG